MLPKRRFKVCPESKDEEDLSDISDISCPEQLSKIKETKKDIAKSYGLTNCEVLFIIFVFNGSIEKNIAYIKLGNEISELKPWSEDEDEIISSTDKSSIKEADKRSDNKFMAERLSYPKERLSYPKERLSYPKE